jgi:transcriptional regulator with XRE-family HTH domain
MKAGRVGRDEVAGLLGIDSCLLEAIEAGKRVIAKSLLSAIARVLEVPVSYFSEDTLDHGFVVDTTSNLNEFEASSLLRAYCANLAARRSGMLAASNPIGQIVRSIRGSAGETVA